MSGRRKLVLGIGAAAVLALSVWTLPPLRWAAFCTEIVNPYEMIDMVVVKVPPGQHERYDDELNRFARARGLWAGSRRDMMDLVPGVKPYPVLQTTACDGFAYVWSENIPVPDEFAVSFHWNQVFGRRSAEKVRADFISEFAPRYKIEVEDASGVRRPVR